MKGIQVFTNEELLSSQKGDYFSLYSRIELLKMCLGELKRVKIVR